MSTVSDDFVSDFDFGGDDIDRDGKGGGVQPSACTFQCSNVVLHTESSGDMQIDLEVLASTVPSEIGKTHHEYIKYPKSDLDDVANGVRRSIIRQVLYALGLTTPAEIKANPRVKIDWSKAIGRCCKGKLVDDTYEGKFKSVLFKKGHWCMWSMQDPKAAGIPEPANMGGNGGNAPQGGPSVDQAPNDPFGNIV